MTPRRVRVLVAAVVAAGLLASCVPPRPPAPGDPGGALGAAKRIYTGWLPYWSSAASLTSFIEANDLMSEISPFWYAAVAGSTPGTIALQRDESSSDRAAVLEAARKARVPVVPTIRDGLGKGGMAAVLADPSARAAHVGQLVDLTVGNGYAGIDIDYEVFAFTDGSASWAATRPNWVAFVAELGAALRDRGKLLAVTVPPQYDDDRDGSSGYWVYDYAGIAPHADRVRIMAYEYSGSRPGPTAPQEWAGRVAAYAARTIPPHKVQLGVASYGYDWVTAVEGQCPAGTASSGRAAITSKTGRALAAREGATPRRDPVSGEMTFRYTRTVSGVAPDGVTPTSCRISREVWYPDAVSNEQKAQLVPRYGLLGLAQWAIGNEDPDQWRLLRPFAQRLNGPAGYVPFGVLDSVRATPDGVTVAGWAIDPETDAPLDVHVYLGDRLVGALRADGERADLATKYPYNGAAHGFRGRVTGTRGTNWLCVYAINQGAGAVNPQIGCELVTLPTGPPFGAFDGAIPGKRSITVGGWAIDPDTTAAVSVHVYVDGALAGTATASAARPDVAAAHPAYGPAHGFHARVPASAGPHRVCVYAIDLRGGGSNPELGCRFVTVT